MNPITVLPVIIAGGSGTRLWPLSRESHPKQFLALAGERTLLQQATWRACAPAGASTARRAWSANEEHRFLVAEPTARGGREPAGADPRTGGPQHRAGDRRGRAARRGGGADPVLLVLPSDHVIGDEAGFRAAVLRAVRGGRSGQRGRARHRPDRGRDRLRLHPCGGRAKRLAARSPASSRSRMRPRRRRYARRRRLLLEQRHVSVPGGADPGRTRRPCAAILAAVEDAFTALAETQGGAYEVPLARYEAVPAEPIDKAVMERSPRIAVVPCDPGWSDLGSWQALWEQLPKDGAGNRHAATSCSTDTRTVWSMPRAAWSGCSAWTIVVVVATPDAVLVAGHRSRGDGVRHLVERCCKAAGRPEPRPTARSIVPGAAYGPRRQAALPGQAHHGQAPGGRLSLQKHHRHAPSTGWWCRHRRGDQWTSGDPAAGAEPEHATSRSAPGASPRQPGRGTDGPIEVQCGSYLGEDDICASRTLYGRS